MLRRTALVANFVLLVASVARAQMPAPPRPDAPDALVAARLLFADALRDEDDGRFREALEKFERVRLVRDTASIEYRIGTCYEALGEAAPAFGAYATAQALGQGDPQGADVLQAATGRLDALAKYVARLRLVMPSQAPASAEVRVDDRAVTPGSGSMPLAPGRHIVSATAAGTIPFRSDMVLGGGDEVSVTVVLEPRVVARAEPPSNRSNGRSTSGWFAIGGGGALAVTGAILLVARHEAIADLNRACPGGLCAPGADANGLESTRSRALVEGPAGVACGVVGVALAAAGVYLVASAHPPANAALVAAAVLPTFARGGAGLAFTGAFR